MKKANQLPISPLREGLNALKVYPSYKLAKVWTRPISVNLLITSRCNSKCITCDSWKLTDHDRELTTEDYFRLSKEMKDLGVAIVTIGGGEPTIRADLWDMIREFKKDGLNVQLTTNALTMREPQRQKIYESGVDRVTVSVDSHIPAIYDRIRGVDGAENVLKHLQAILSEKPKNLEIDTNTVLCADNADTFLETLDHLTAMGIPKVNFSAVTTSGSNYLMVEKKDSLAEIPLEKIDEIIAGLLIRKKESKAINASTSFIKGLRAYYANPNQLVFPCYAGYLTLDIFQDGSVHGCGNLPSFANVRDENLRSIWRGLEAEKNRRDMAEGKCPNCYLSCKIELAIAADPLKMPQFALEKLF